MRKSGITLISIVLYVLLFFAFSTFAILMSTNVNYKTLSEKGTIYIAEQVSKLEYNLIKSAKSSSTVENVNNKIVFSNNDEYIYDKSSKKILKNGGTLITDVENFNLKGIDGVNNVSVEYLNNVDIQKSKIVIEVVIKKYGSSRTSQIVITAGDGVNE